MGKAERDFGFVSKYKSYEDMMLDYKAELESGRWDALINSRKKG